MDIVEKYNEKKDYLSLKAGDILTITGSWMSDGNDFKGRKAKIITLKEADWNYCDDIINDIIYKCPDACDICYHNKLRFFLTDIDAGYIYTSCLFTFRYKNNKELLYRGNN